MLNLSTTYPLRVSHQVLGLPVLVDLNWFGRIMTRPDAGIIRFANAYRPVNPQSSDNDFPIL